MVTTVTAKPELVVSRSWQLVAAVIAMMAIANLQYAWTLFTTPLTQSFSATLAAVQVAFAAFVLAETWLTVSGSPGGPPWPAGHHHGRRHPGGPGLDRSPHAFPVGIVRRLHDGGIGAGAVYGACIGHSLKWFPDHRGLCAGVVAGAYGIGTAATVAPIARMINTAGYAHTFVVWGCIQGIVERWMGLFIIRPPAGWLPAGWTAEKEEAIRAHQHVGGGHDAGADGTTRLLLGHLSHDGAHGLHRLGGHGPTEAHRCLLSGGQGGRGLRDDRPDPRHPVGSDPERPDPALLGMGLSTISAARIPCSSPSGCSR